MFIGWKFQHGIKINFPQVQGNSWENPRKMFSLHAGKTILTTLWKGNGSRMGKTLLKKNKERELGSSISKACYKSAVMQTARCCCRGGHTEGLNRNGPTTTCPELGSDKNIKAIQ